MREGRKERGREGRREAGREVFVPFLLFPHQSSPSLSSLPLSLSFLSLSISRKRKSSWREGERSDTFNRRRNDYDKYHRETYLWGRREEELNCRKYRCLEVRGKKHWKTLIFGISEGKKH